MKVTNETVLKQFDRLINQVLALKRRSFFEFKGVRFYPSEVHLLLVVKEKIATNATHIADELGITKGAVSQTLSRLEGKGVLVKTKDPNNKNQLTLSFTPFGAEAFRYYSRRAGELIRKHHEYLKGFTAKEKAAVQRFLQEAERVLGQIG